MYTQTKINHNAKLMVNPLGTAKKTGGDSQFFTIEKDPHTKEVQMMIALALARAVTTYMAKHFYTFEGAIPQQKDSGAIE